MFVWLFGKINVILGDCHEDEKEDVVTPWDVASASAKGVDYEKLIGKILGVAHII